MKQLLWRSMQEGLNIEMIYLNTSGELTQRIIQVKKVHPTYIKAYCFMRKNNRTFKLNNILSIDTIRRRKGA